MLLIKIKKLKFQCIKLFEDFSTQFIQHEQWFQVPPIINCNNELQSSY